MVKPHTLLSDLLHVLTNHWLKLSRKLNSQISPMQSITISSLTSVSQSQLTLSFPPEQSVSVQAQTQYNMTEHDVLMQSWRLCACVCEDVPWYVWQWQSFVVLMASPAESFSTLSCWHPENSLSAPNDLKHGASSSHWQFHTAWRNNYLCFDLAASLLCLFAPQIGQQPMPAWTF